MPGMWQMTLRVMREEGGVRGLYRGIMATSAGVAPYVGCNFATYEFLRGIITPPDNATVPRKLLCGALAGSISQTLTYPFDVLRRKMQVTAMGYGVMGYKYNGAIDAMRHIWRNEGLPGLYRGLWPNLRKSLTNPISISRTDAPATVKVAPSIATSFFTYETVKEFLINAS